MKRSDLSDENAGTNSNEEPKTSHIKSWDEIDAEIEARMRRDSETEAFGEKVIEERSAAYPHKAILDG